MSGHSRSNARTQSAPLPETRAERRQMRRAGVSLQVRIRTADFNDGNFDEVRVTQNASRKAIYFFTELNRYYKGMRLRVTSPYEAASAGAANPEQIGEVVRVHRREGGYGVAVALPSNGQAVGVQSSGLSTTTQSAEPQTTGMASSKPHDRRCATRSPFIAPIEMLEMRTGSRLKARTWDLSLQGCYVDTLNPLAVGSAVRLQIHRAGLIFDVLATVSSQHAGCGMGLEFGEISGAQKAVLEKWLEELALPPRNVFDNPLLSATEATISADCAVRLVQMLLRKGVLSQSEATQVLCDSKA
jgi:PilZ domain